MTDHRRFFGCGPSVVCLSLCYEHPNIPLAIILSILMWPCSTRATTRFTSFYPELFPTRARVSGMAIAQNRNHADGADAGVFLHRRSSGFNERALDHRFDGVSRDHHLSHRRMDHETFGVHLNDLDKPGAQPVDKAEYDRLRRASLAVASVADSPDVGRRRPSLSRAATPRARCDGMNGRHGLDGK